MTGSAFSLYLEETKTIEESMFQSGKTPQKKEEDLESKNNKLNKLNKSNGPGKISKMEAMKEEHSGALPCSALELHKVFSLGKV